MLRGANKLIAYLPYLNAANSGRGDSLIPLSETADDTVVRRRLRIRGPRIFRCLVCGRLSFLTWGKGSLRESIVCLSCNAFNRQRQIAGAILSGSPFASLRAFVQGCPSLAVLNAESKGALHCELKRLTNYVGTEYLGPDLEGGTRVDGVLHQDFQRLSFADRSFDLVVSSDVFEHIPDPYAAHAEVFRVLRPGGRHVMTAPVRTEGIADEVRAIQHPDGRVELLMEAEMHGDPLRPEGILAFRRFGIESLLRCESLGFHCRLIAVQSAEVGILGAQCFVFEFAKPRSG